MVVGFMVLLVKDLIFVKLKFQEVLFIDVGSVEVKVKLLEVDGLIVVDVKVKVDEMK